MRTLGFADRCDRASTRRRVRCTLLSVRSRFRACVHRASAMGAPARLMTALAPSRHCSQAPGSRPFHSTVVTELPNSWEAVRPFVVRTVTRWPFRDKDAHKARPMNPVPPVTTTFIRPFYFPFLSHGTHSVGTRGAPLIARIFRSVSKLTHLCRIRVVSQPNRHYPHVR